MSALSTLNILHHPVDPERQCENPALPNFLLAIDAGNNPSFDWFVSAENEDC
jgi:hypothetical protein